MPGCGEAEREADEPSSETSPEPRSEMPSDEEVVVRPTPFRVDEPRPSELDGCVSVRSTLLSEPRSRDVDEKKRGVKKALRA